MIGGKPNVALYFIGCVGKEVIYLDPHNTQKTGFVDNKETEEQIELDLTYHCKYASRINILKMDPSVAVVSLFSLTYVKLLACIERYCVSSIFTSVFVWQFVRL